MSLESPRTAEPLATLRSSPRDALVAEILRALDGIRYGAVELVVHDGRVVQIERRERLRIEHSGRDRAPGVRDGG